jgi:hypothetical protein
LAYFVIADLKRLLVCLDVPHKELVVLEAYQVEGVKDVAQAARVLPLVIPLDKLTLRGNLHNASGGS